MWSEKQGHGGSETALLEEIERLLSASPTSDLTTRREWLDRVVWEKTSDRVKRYLEVTFGGSLPNNFYGVLYGQFDDPCGHQEPDTRDILPLKGVCACFKAWLIEFRPRSKLEPMLRRFPRSEPQA